MKRLLQLASFGVFMGHGWEHLLNGGPYRAFFLNDSIMQGLAESIGYQWINLLQDPTVDAVIMQGGRALGLLFVIAAIVSCFAQKLPKFVNRIFLIGGAVLLFFYAFCLFLEKGQLIGLWLEYTAQFTSPLLLFAALYWSISSPKMIFSLKVIIAITFVCHGLFAMGYYPRPGHFVDMMIYGFGIKESAAHQVLFYIGILDIVIAILFFVPVQFLVYSALTYAFIWGFLTSIARMVTTFQADLFFSSLNQNIPEFLFRFPHFLLPFIVILLIFQWNRRHRAIGL